MPFGRDALERIVDATFADGRSARYFYDDLGARTLAEHGDGSSVVYTRNAAGSMVGIETTGRDGKIQRQTVSLRTAEPIAQMAYDGSCIATIGIFGRVASSEDVTEARQAAKTVGRTSSAELSSPPMGTS